jgi:hypothetical protein
MTGARCSARKKRTGEQCGSFPMANGKCRVHGGATPSGVALPQTKTGRYSKHLPTRLAARYEEARSDPDLLTLRDDIGLLDTRMGQVVGALDTGESKETWSALLAIWGTFEEQFQSLLDTGEPPEEMEATVSKVSALVRAGLSESYVWAEIRSLMKQRAELVANERQRMVQLQQMITSEQAMVLLASLVSTIKRHVHDRDALAAISAELGALALRPAR